MYNMPKQGRFDEFGGQYVPETLMNAILELDEAFHYYKDDPEFNKDFNKLLNEYAGRPSLLTFANNLTNELGGPKIYLKREDLNQPDLTK